MQGFGKFPTFNAGLRGEHFSEVLSHSFSNLVNIKLSFTSIYSRTANDWSSSLPFAHDTGSTRSSKVLARLFSNSRETLPSRNSDF